MITSPLVRSGSAVVGVAGMLMLAGCSSAPESTDKSSASGTPAPEYRDGTYTAQGSYQTPESVEKISVTLTLSDGVVSDVAVSGDPQTPETTKFQGQFIGGIADEVVGVSLEDIKVSRVAGSSLTSGGFNAAVALIKEQAAA